MLNLKQQKRLAGFEKELAMPAWKYILIYGLTFSILYIILSWGSDFVLEEKTIPQAIASKPLRYLFAIPFCTISYGLLSRWIVNLQYKSLKKKAVA